MDDKVPIVIGSIMATVVTIILAVPFTGFNSDRTLMELWFGGVGVGVGLTLMWCALFYWIFHD